jgi:HAE1 family hydrophobic/amphiphilic exporter-1
MDFIKFSIQNPVKVSVGVLMLALFGVLALFSIPIQLTPNVDQPIVKITTMWTGRSPDDVEREIIEKQEDKVKTVSNLKKMSAIAYEGQAEITLEFYVGTDMREVLLEVSDKLREVSEKPDDADEPVVKASASSSESPIAWTILSSDDASFDIGLLTDYVDDRVRPYLERIGGVSEARIFGGRERQVHIQIDPQLMAQRSITFNQLREAIQRTNVNVSAGSISDGRLDVRVRTVGEYNDLDKIRETVIVETPGGPIRVRDLGKVTMSLQKERGFVRNKGRAGLAIPVYREVGANVMQVMAEVRARVKTIQDEILPSIGEQIKFDMNLASVPKFNFEQVYDETVYIDDSIAVVLDNLWIGSTLTALVLLCFLRSIRPTLIVAVSIPISVIGTFVAMYAAGRNINVISLAGLAFAVGMVVDNAIVVLENIDRHLALGRTPAEAAYKAAREVWGAVLASTLTTVAVFGPVLFIQEEAGQLFRDIALAICAAVLLSMIVSVTVIPSAAVFVLRKRSESRSAFMKAAHGLFGLAAGLDWLIVKFADMLLWLSQPRFFRVVARLVIVLGLTAFFFVGAAIIKPPTTYLPAGNRNLVFGFIMTPPGYNKAHDRVLAESVERVVRPYWLAKDYADTAACPAVVDKFTGQVVQHVPPMENFFFVSVAMGMFTGGTSVDKENVRPLGSLLNNAIGTIPGAYGGAQQRSLFETGLGGNNRIDIEVTGFNMNEIRSSAGALFGALGQKYGMQNLRPNPGNFNVPGPELRVEIDEQRAKALKIDTSAMGLGVQALIDGAIIGEYRISGKAIDLLLVRDPNYELTADTLGDVPISATDEHGNKIIVPLSTIATFSRVDAPQTIQRIEEQRSVTLSLTPPENQPLEQVMADIKVLTDGMKASGAIPPTVAVEQAGTASKLDNVRSAMIGKWTGWNWPSIGSLVTSRLFLAMLITYLLMAALFESWLYPFIIMFSVPPAVIGGFVGLALVHRVDPLQQLDVITMLGFVILIGTVVNNAILVVHQSLNYMRGIGDGEGDSTGKVPPLEAIRLSVRTRVKPVMMTTVTTLFGMLPLVLSPGAGSELYRGLGAVVLSGLLCSTIFTLLVVPLIFSLMIQFQATLRWALGLRPAHETGAMNVAAIPNVNAPPVSTGLPGST